MEKSVLLNWGDEANFTQISQPENTENGKEKYRPISLISTDSIILKIERDRDRESERKPNLRVHKMLM